MGAKTRKTAEATEVIDLEWDGESKDRSLDQDGSVPVPARWQAASFLAQERGKAIRTKAFQKENGKDRSEG